MSLKPLFALAAAVVLAAAAPAAEDPPVLAAAKKALKHPDKPFAMWVTVTAKAGKEKELEAALMACRKPTRQEKGNVAYDVNGGGDRKYAFYEKWKNVDALADHLAADHTKKLLAQFKELLDGDPKVEVLPAVEE